MTVSLGSQSGARALAMVILVMSMGAIGSAFAAQYVFGVEPCVLCLYQRVPYAITGALAALAIFLSVRGQLRPWLVTACGLVFLAGSALAFYHVGVQQHWWASVAACGGELSSGVSVTDLTAQLSGPQPKPCDEVDWSLLGLSMAGYNSVMSLALGVAAITGGWYLGKESEE